MITLITVDGRSEVVDLSVQSNRILEKLCALCQAELQDRDMKGDINDTTGTSD